MYHNSQRTNQNFKPKWPRLQFLMKKRDADRLADLHAFVDDEYLIRFKSKSPMGR